MQLKGKEIVLSVPWSLEFARGPAQRLCCRAAEQRRAGDGERFLQLHGNPVLHNIILGLNESNSAGQEKLS